MPRSSTPSSSTSSSSAPLQLHGSARTVAAGLERLSRLSPALATRLAARLFFLVPPRMKVRPEAAAGLAAGTPLSVRVDGRALPVWRWGTGPVVLVQHGWGGRAAQLWPIIEALCAAGLSPVALDAPGHGAAGGWQAHIPLMARALCAVADAVGPVHGVVAHSLGGPVVSLALRRGLSVRRVVFLSPAADPGSWLRAWVGHFSAGDDTLRRRVEQRVERRVGEPMSALHVPHHATRRAEPLLVIHDRTDREVPWHDGEAIGRSWPGAALHSTEGLGHRTILRDPAVVQRITAFIRQDAWCSCGEVATTADSQCAQCAFEEEIRVPWRRAALPGVVYTDHQVSMR